MRFIVFIFTLIFLLSAHADDVKIELNPQRPVAGEVFQAIFRISTDAEEEPVVNFSPSGVEVIGKSNQGVSVRSVYANGKLTVSRELTIVYELVANKVGLAGIRDITVQVGTKSLRHGPLSFNVLKEAEERPEVFIQADVPKTTVYIGEGFVVRYYLYSKVPLNNLDVKRYPKLDNFLKRFLQEPDRSERVSVDGDIYLRTQIYAAKLFPEKVGELKIDSLGASATYSPSRGNPFGAFGMGMGGSMRTRSMNSETVKVQVLPLPTPVPTHFTGLVGKHEFQIEFGQNKLIVNEPLEVKLTISGGGALENVEAPTILQHPGLEEFESNGDLKIADADRATKVFDYTFLAKENLKLPATSLTLSYFDSDSQQYVPVQLEVPAIEVAGGGTVAKPRKEEAPGEEKSDRVQKSRKQEIAEPLDLAGPIMEGGATIKRYLPYLNLGLGFLSLLVALGWFIKVKGAPSFSSSAAVPSEFKKGQFNLAQFTRWMTPLIEKTGKSPLTIIRESSLPDEAKAYFIDLLNSNDYKDYSSRKAQMQFTYRSSHFKELGRYIESAKNEDSSQPS